MFVSEEEVTSNISYCDSSQRKGERPDVVVNASNPTLQELEAGVKGQPRVT